MSNGTTLIIDPDDYNKVNDHWEQVDIIEKETRVVAKFNVTSTSNPTQLCGSMPGFSFSEIEIDGVVQPSVISTYTFDTLGEHTVKYTLEDPINIRAFSFGDCSNLTSIVIPNSIISIDGQVFSGCTSLTSCTIGSRVTSIGTYAFSNCISLTSIVCNATTAPTIDSYTFRNVKDNGTLTVPTGSTGYDTWMQNDNYYLGLYNWTKVEQ